MIEKGIDLDDGAFREALRNAPVKRDPIDSIRTRYWYGMLQMKADLSSAYALERRFEPEAFVESGPVRYHRNKWPAYRDGRRTPRASLVARVDAQLPGSARQIDHVLWRALRVRKPVLPVVDLWVRELEPYLQRLVFEKTARDPASARRRRQVDSRLFNTLGRNPTLDSLACLTMFLREASERGNAELAYQAIAPILDILIVNCALLPMYTMADELFEFYKNEIFSLAGHEHKRSMRHMDKSRFLEDVNNCVIYVAKSEDLGEEFCGWNDCLKKMLDALKRYRFRAAVWLD